jgi:hypothetical protein
MLKPPNKSRWVGIPTRSTSIIAKQKGMSSGKNKFSIFNDQFSNNYSAKREIIQISNLKMQNDNAKFKI